MIMSDVEIPSVLCVGANMPNPKTHMNTLVNILVSSGSRTRWKLGTTFFSQKAESAVIKGNLEIVT